MNCYQATRYCVGGIGGDIEWQYDYPAGDTVRLWEESGQSWTRDLESGDWTADGVADSQHLQIELLLEDFGPLWDTPPGVV